MVDINDFNEERECEYKGEHYSVRDNGAVMRHPREGKRLRKDDNKWTFGRPNIKTGYMEICGQRVHRIVAFAFLGKPEEDKMVVDHKDTNRQNNRPENLRWLTRLDNVLLNPITCARIENICGSVEAFLADPTLLRGHERTDPNFSWMRTVTREEAKSSYDRLTKWAENHPESKGGKIGEWIFKPKKENLFDNKDSNSEEYQSFRFQRPVRETEEVKPIIEDWDYSKPLITESLTPNAVQVDWKTPSEFPCCPQNAKENELEEYQSNLKEGAVFCKNDLYTSSVLDSALIDDDKSLIVMTTSGEDSIKPWALAKVTFQDGKYVHENLGSYFSKDGALKNFTLEQGMKWTGGDSIDDYC